MKKIFIFFIKVVALFVTVNILGFFFWPFASYLSGCDIGILCYWVSATVAIIGLIQLTISFLRKKSKKMALWILGTSCALYSCFFVTIYERYGENGHFNGEYISLDNYPHGSGLADKFGREFIEPQFDGIYKVFSNENASYIYVCIKNPLVVVDSVINGESIPFCAPILYLYNEDGKLQKIDNVTESDCDYLWEHIEKHIGKTITDNDYLFKLRIKKTVYENNSSKRGKSTNEQFEMKTNKEKQSDEEVEEVVVRHVHEKRQVWKERWKPCISCDRGKCRNCHGQGGYYIGNIYNVCPSCNGTGACVWCGGRGEIMETYSTWE